MEIGMYCGGGGLSWGRWAPGIGQSALSRLDEREAASRVSDRMIMFFEVCAFPPSRQEKAKGWGTELIQTNAVEGLV